MHLKDLWLSIIQDLSKEIQRSNIITWFKNTAISSLDEDGVLTVGLPLPVFLDWHERKYSKVTLEAAKRHDPKVKTLAYVIDITLNDQDERIIDLVKHFPGKASRKMPKRNEVKINGMVKSKIFNIKYSLDRFIVAPENRLAYAASMTVAKHPGENYNPLFIYGNVGLGKTHLLQSIGQEVLRNDPSKIVVYTTTEDFTNELIDGIQSRNMNRFRNKYRKVDVFIIDDIQFIANKDRTQEEFFHTFNTLYEAGKQIIISSDRPPSELKLLQDRLTSRFESGMIVDVKMPDYESRLAILKERCQECQVFINDKILELIAFNIDNSVRALLGALNQVIAQYELQNLAPTINSVTEIINRANKSIKVPNYHSVNTHSTVSIGTPTQASSKAVTINRLIDVVSEYFTISRDDVLSSSRSREYVVPRQIIMYLAKSKLRMSLSKIGQDLGNRNHTTVMHAINKMKLTLKSDRQLLCDINAIAKEVGIN